MFKSVAYKVPEFCKKIKTSLRFNLQTILLLKITTTALARTVKMNKCRIIQDQLTRII